MKWYAAWWGVQLVAETDNDEKVLRELRALLPEQAHDCYEEGIQREQDHISDPYEGLTGDDEPARYVIRLNR